MQWLIVGITFLTQSCGEDLARARHEGCEAVGKDEERLRGEDYSARQEWMEDEEV